MTDDNANQIDAEMGELLGEPIGGDTGTPESPEAPKNAPQTSPQVWKAGGREFKTPDELAKAYDNVWRMHGKLQNEAKPWFEYRDYLGKNPDVRREMANVITKYQKGREAGLSQKQAEQASGVSPEVAEKLERYDAMFEDAKVEKEIGSLRSKYKLNNDQIREVLNVATAQGGIPLELAYKAYAHDSGYQAAKAKAEEEAKKRADASRVGGVGAKAPAVSAAPKGFSLAADKSWRSQAGAGLDKLGITD